MPGALRVIHAKKSECLLASKHPSQYMLGIPAVSGQTLSAARGLGVPFEFNDRQAAHKGVCEVHRQHRMGGRAEYNGCSEYERPDPVSRQRSCCANLYVAKKLGFKWSK